MTHCNRSTIVIGAGPAGLAAADELIKLGRSVTIVEQDQHYVGGLSRTVKFNGCRFDLGGHRFFSKNPEIRDWWAKRLGSDFLEVPRISRILYRRRYFDYPLNARNALAGLGPFEALQCVLSYLLARVRPIAPENSFEDWVCNRFGRRLFSIFFKTYTEKVWGIPCNKISVDWAAQRIKGLSLLQAATSALGIDRKSGKIKTLIDRFHYPRLGCGMMWERTCQDLIKAGAEIRMGQKVVGISRYGDKIGEVELEDSEGNRSSLQAEDFIISMPLRDLVHSFNPPLSTAAQSAANRLSYRNLLIVALVVEHSQIFPDHWIYIHDDTVRLGRIANFKNWSSDMVEDQNVTGLGLDYFCTEGDAMWSLSDNDIVALAKAELEAIGIAPAALVSSGQVIRVERAYPVLDSDYQLNVTVIRDELARFANLKLAGRNGMHKYNNQDHSMLTGIMAARATNGAHLDPWRVNIDAEYIEDGPADDSARLLPRKLSQS
jgi:protoporphyrinogen oxidase